MSDQPEDQTPAPDTPEAGDSSPEPQKSGPPAPDIPEVVDTGPNPEIPGESRDEVAAGEDSEARDSGEVLAIGQGELSESDDRTFGMLVHLLGAMTFLVGPIIIWLIKKEESPFVDDQGKESVNWQIGIAVAWVGFSVLMKFPNNMISCFSWLLLAGVVLANLIFCILASVEANKGKAYRYPFNLRLIK